MTIFIREEEIKDILFLQYLHKLIIKLGATLCTLDNILDDFCTIYASFYCRMTKR